jgi:spore germination protein KA
MGFFGIGLVIACLLAYLTTYTSFGVPFLSPLTPHYRSSADMILRLPVQKERVRPHNLNPQDAVRRPERIKQR